MDDGDRENNKQQMDAMKHLGFEIISEVNDTWSYAKKVAEYPPHLTDGTSWLHLSRNQAADYLDIIQTERSKAALDAQLKLVRQITTDKGDAYFQAVPLGHYQEQLEAALKQGPTNAK